MSAVPASNAPSSALPAPDPACITGLVLAGGLSRRMGGQDKGLQPLAGRPLVAHVLARLRPQVGALAISANARRDEYAALLGTTAPAVWPDTLPPGVDAHPGPLAGWLTGLQRCTTPWLLSVPCDAPRLPDDLVRRLADAARAAGAPAAYAVLRQADGSLAPQPVFALLHRSLAPALADCLLDGERRVRVWLQSVRAATAVFDADPDGAAFANLNTPDELARLERPGADTGADTAAATPAEAAPDALDERWPGATVLVVDDEPGMRHFLEKTLTPRVGQVLGAGSAEEAEALLRRHRVDLVLLDIALPGKNGIVLLREMRAAGITAEVVLITAFADLETAIEALRAGASDMLLKPFRITQALGAVRHALERAQLRRENWVLRRTLSQRTPPADGLVGQSIVVKGLQAALRRIAAVDSTVLLSGESGTGKELAALALHRLSTHARAPFVPVNCATTAPAQLEAELFGHDSASGPGREGLFVAAHGGTLFLDEIGELPPPLQATLLRVLEDRCVRVPGSERSVPVEVRIVAATNRPLADDVREGRFRADLYYRLQVVELRLPPLRAHKEDIPELVAHFIDTLAPRLGVAPIEVSADEMRYLEQYDWPGNVRELRNLIERSLIVGALNVSALYQSLPRPAPTRPRSTAPAEDPVALDLHTLEKRHILAVLEAVCGDKTEAAQRLGISRRTLERRLAEWAEAGAHPPR